MKDNKNINVEFEVVYSPGFECGKNIEMPVTKIKYGTPTALAKNLYKRNGYKFLGWYAFRKSDGKMCYSDSEGTRKFFVPGKQPKGFEPFLYPNGIKLARLSKINGDTIFMSAQWENLKDTVEFTIEFEAGFESDENTGKMPPITVKYGHPSALPEIAYNREGYTFLGWYTSRKSDGKVCYQNSEGKRVFFSPGKQPEGFKVHLYPDRFYVSRLSKKNGDKITMSARWERTSAADFREMSLAERKEFYEQRLLNAENVVLYGSAKMCSNFMKKFSSVLNIRKVFVDIPEELENAEKLGLDAELYNPKCITKNDMVIICHNVKIRLDQRYRDCKKKLAKNGFVFMQNFMRADIASMLLEHKKLWLWLGYCQLDTLRMHIFQKINSVNKDYIQTAFRYELDTVEKAYKFEDCVELLKICDVLSYLPVIFNDGKLDFKYEDYLPPETRKIAIPRTPMKAYYPYRETDAQIFYKYRFDGKLHWPFIYSESIIDQLVLEGKTDEEIYNELMREDLIPEKTIKTGLKIAYKAIQISEATADIKMLDFIKENFNKRLLYRDGLHYKNFVYFEIARRISDFLGLDCREEIDLLEKVTEEKEVHFIDFSEVPVLPCVVKALGLDFITDDTLYRVKFSEKGAQRGTKEYHRVMNRKDWIYTYAKFTRASIDLCDMWYAEIK